VCVCPPVVPLKTPPPPPPPLQSASAVTFSGFSDHFSVFFSFHGGMVQTSNFNQSSLFVAKQKKGN
jgi:hypothetical protein